MSRCFILERKWLRVGQDIRRRIANCFVAVENASNTIAADYTISAASIPLDELPPDESRRLPRYPTVPAVRIGRLAVNQRFQGRGLGAALLADAAIRALKAEAAAFTLLVDAKDDRGVAFYQRFGLFPLASRPRTLFLPLAVARKVLPGS